ncbi:unnamed protein product [Rotaria sordida]|uniref:Uncharacterized protein n=1 Tax=Rotaria sordida TaxID=392033 RepID=A0A813NN62_9BILA|nr:unnamed protein product [Rotaria sordida]
MYLGWIDYGVLVLLLSFSAGIGIYQGCIRSKQLSAREFLVADGRMTVLPTAISLLAGVRSAGGIKAVIWTDVIQAVMMFLGIIMSIVFGSIDAGEIVKAVETVSRGNRFQFWVIIPDPSVRYTLWSLFIGLTFFDVAVYACTQTQAQRYMCVKDTKATQSDANSLGMHWMSYLCKIILQIFGVFTAPILGIYLLGLFTAHVQSRSALMAFILCLVFQMWILVGSTLTVKPPNKQGGRLPTSVVGCVPSVNISVPMSKNQNYNPLISLYSIAPTWFVFNGTIITLLLGVVFSFIFDSKDSKMVDKSLIISRDEIFSFFSSRKETMKRTLAQKDDGIPTDNTMIERESMLKT